MAKLLRKSSSTGLLDLPQSTILHIAEFLPCKDLPSLVCTCRELAGMAARFYEERTVLDMQCFGEVSPPLCMQIIRRFSSSHLAKCYFRCDLHRHSWTSPAILQAVVERFLDNYRCDEDLVRDLHAESAAENAEWLPVAAAPRPIDALAHCFLLECLLSDQPSLSELVLDVEFGVFRVPKSRGGHRQHWYLMQPFLALQCIQRKCPSLERYACGLALYQNSAADIKHVQARFLQNSKQLKSVSTRFELDRSSVESYCHFQLQLEQAGFLLPKWCARHADSAHDHGDLRSFAQNFPHLKTAAMAFSSRAALKCAAEFLRELAAVRSLVLKCEFQPSFDIDEGPQMGAFFEGVWSILPVGLKKLALVNVPESEFGIVFGAAVKVQKSLKHLRVRFVSWSSAELGTSEAARIESFFGSFSSLRSLSVQCYNQQGSLVFGKTVWRR